jgi:hypothetical protein
MGRRQYQQGLPYMSLRLAEYTRPSHFRAHKRIRSSSKIHVIFVRFEHKLEHVDSFQWNFPTTYFIKILSVVLELLHVDRRMYRDKQTDRYAEAKNLHFYGFNLNFSMQNQPGTNHVLYILSSLEILMFYHSTKQSFCIHSQDVECLVRCAV